MPKNKMILIVDDDPDDREFFAEALQEVAPAAKCIGASNGIDALQQMRNGMLKLPDYIFLDLNMPGMDGKECLAALKSDALLREIPVIIFTTSSSQKDKDDTRALGAAYFLTKPTSYHKLCEEILLVLNNQTK